MYECRYMHDLAHMLWYIVTRELWVLDLTFYLETGSHDPIRPVSLHGFFCLHLYLTAAVDYRHA